MYRKPFLDSPKKIATIVFGALGFCFFFFGLIALIITRYPICWFFILFGLPFLLVAFLLWRSLSKKTQLMTRLLAENHFVDAEILSIQRNPLLRVNNAPTYFMEAQYTGPDGISYHYTSDTLLKNLQPFITSNTVRVYYDVSNPSIYYMDVDSCLPQGFYR